MKTTVSIPKPNKSSTVTGGARPARAVRLLLLLLLTLPAAVRAQFTFVTNNGVITITKYIGPGGDVIIPDTIAGLPVAYIGEEAFMGCSVLTAVTIPGSVVSIASDAFSHCHSLTSITLLSGVKSIAACAFSFCPGLTTVEIPDSVSHVDGSAFVCCTSLTQIAVDARNSWYSSLGGVLFNKNHTTLIECPGGKTGSYEIPNSVTRIGSAAFDGCAGLTSITIPASVTSIGVNAFSSCPNLGVITVDALNSCYGSEDGVLFNQNRMALIRCPEGKAGSYAVPDSVTSIKDSAFQFCHLLTSVTMPNSVVEVGDGTFFSCGSLTNVLIGNGVTNIGEYAFYGCTNLTSAVIGNSVRGIGSDAFAYCHRLASVTIPDGVTEVGDWAFYECTGLTRLTIGSGVTNLGNSAFRLCSSLIGAYFRGHAPNLLPSVFSGDINATAYYLPGTTGWAAWAGPPPAVLWNPQVRQLGVQANQFRFTIVGTANIPILVEASTNLTDVGWTSLQTITLTNGSFYFSDPDWINYPARFYRLRWP